MTNNSARGGAVVKNQVKNKWHGLVATWQNFFFAKVPTGNILWMRRGTSAILFLFFAIRAIDFNFIFGDRGILPPQTMLSAIPEFYRPPFFVTPPDENAAMIVQIALMIFLALQIFGVGEKFGGGRPMAFTVWLLNLSLSQRNYVVLYGADYVSCAWLFYLMFIRSDGKQDLLSSGGFRLLQFQVCTIYGVGGLEKFRGQTWWEGTALWRALGNPIYTTHDYSFVSYFPLLLAIATIFTAFWEVYFPVMVWSKKHRGWYLCVGAGIHLGIAILMNLNFFSLFMVVTYILFWDEVPGPSVIRKWRGRGSFSSLLEKQTV